MPISALQRAASLATPTELLDHFIRLRQDRSRNPNPERLRGPQVNHNSEPDAVVDGDVRRLGAVEDLRYDPSGKPIPVGDGAPE